MPSFSMSMSPSLRRALNWGGSGFALIGILFVGFRLHSYWFDLDLSRITPLDWGFIAALSFIYGLANFLLAIAWWHLLHHFSATTRLLASIRIYGMSQLARYVPGNIFHLAGRQALGMAADIPSGILIRSSIFELGLIAFAGSLFGWLVLPQLLPGFPEVASISLLLGSTVVVAGSLRGIVGRRAALSFIWQMVFLLVSGAVFVALLHLISGGEGLSFQEWLIVGGAYIVAWLAGLITPGAPAGVGVREIILLLLLRGLVSETDLLLVVLLGRLVTVVGDLLFYLTAISIPSN